LLHDDEMSLLSLMIPRLAALNWPNSSLSLLRNAAWEQNPNLPVTSLSRSGVRRGDERHGSWPRQAAFHGLSAWFRVA
jgi:hypothetical protein